MISSHLRWKNGRRPNGFPCEPVGRTPNHGCLCVTPSGSPTTSPAPTTTSKPTTTKPPLFAVTPFASMSLSSGPGSVGRPTARHGPSSLLGEFRFLRHATGRLRGNTRPSDTVTGVARSPTTTTVSPEIATSHVWGGISRETTFAASPHFRTIELGPDAPQATARSPTRTRAYGPRRLLGIVPIIRRASGRWS